MLVASPTYGGISILPPLASPGSGGTAVSPLVLIFLAFLTLGFLLSRPALCLPAPSDHRGVNVSISLPDAVPPGPGFWKFNVSILNDPIYVLLAEDAWASWRRTIHRFPSLERWWDRVKKLIKSLTIRYCVSKSKAASENRALLVRRIDHLRIKVDMCSTSCIGPYRVALAEIAEMDMHLAKGAQVRSRAPWVEEGESTSAYLFRIEGKQAAKRWISALRESGGTIVSSPADLRSSFLPFYTDLFLASPTDPSARAALLRSLTSRAQSASCEGHITLGEATLALRVMARRKSPGLDGLPCEFYLKFWHVLGPYFGFSPQLLSSLWLSLFVSAQWSYFPVS